jgi:predicted nucleic acid-binding protein
VTLQRYTAILDANVIYPINVFDVLAHLCLEGIFIAKWSEEIDAEWTRNLILNRPDLNEQDIYKRRDLQRIAIADSWVEKKKYQFLINQLVLPDEKDRHVLAAAIACKADAILTFNLKDFPSSILDQYGIQVVHPDDFICQQLKLLPQLVLNTFKKIRQKLKNPSFTPEQLAQSYRNSGLVRTSTKLNKMLEWI